MQQYMRLFQALGCLFMAAVVLSACTGIPKPFSRDKGFFQASDPQSPPVTISAIDGAPKAAVDRMASQLYTEAKHRGFTATVGTKSKRSITMKGHLTAASTVSGTTVIYVWDVRSPNGASTHRISGEETIPGGQAFADPWSAVDDSALQRIAAKTADELSLIISQLGFDVRMASVPPPADMLFDQADSIQTASIVDGYRARVQSAETDPVAVTPATQTQQASVTPPKTQKSSTTTSKPRKQADAIAVPSVVGAKGRGNAELSAAMRQAMAVAGVPVIKKRRNGAITVAGTVKLSPPAGSRQTVELSWRVLDAKGGVLGTITQKNQVPSGSLDNGFGPTAKLAAQAAASGIFKLLSSVE